MPDQIKCTVYLPQSLHERCKELAEADGRKLSAWIQRQLSALISDLDCARHRIATAPHDIRDVSEYPTREENLHG